MILGFQKTMKKLKILLGFNMNLILPLATIRSKNEYEALVDKNHHLHDFENKLVKNVKSDNFYYEGFCLACNKDSNFLVDNLWGGIRDLNSWIPNWRERLVCSHCEMNNRQRLVSSVFKQNIDGRVNLNLYLMEQITPIFSWAKKNLDAKITGSEYLSSDLKSGVSINGVRHEDIQGLSFPDDHFDFILSNDVFEHIPNPKKGFEESARVLKQGGVMIFTIPFFTSYDSSLTRATLAKDGSILNHATEIYHGNPLNAAGSLVFTDFGWDILSDIKSAGFLDAYINFYYSKDYAHLGNYQSIFFAQKA